MIKKYMIKKYMIKKCMIKKCMIKKYILRTILFLSIFPLTLPTTAPANEIQNTCADFNVGGVHFKVGTQALAISRGFLFDSEFSGLNVTFNTGSLKMPVIWIQDLEGDTGQDINDDDTDFYGVLPTLSINKDMHLQSVIVYSTKENTERDSYYLGLNLDASFDPTTLWFSGIYNGGDNGDMDYKSFLVALGGTLNLGAHNLHGQGFYASGDDDADHKEVSFTALKGQSYNWSEIMGCGILNNPFSHNAPNEEISNVMAVNIGTTLSPLDKLKVSADLWYAERVETNGEEALGTEIDLKITYKLVEGLDLDVIAAYLFAGEAKSDENPYEVGTRLSLDF